MARPVVHPEPRRQVQVRLPDDLLDRVDRLAERNLTSRTYVIEHALRVLVDGGDGPPTAECMLCHQQFPAGAGYLEHRCAKKS